MAWGRVLDSGVRDRAQHSSGSLSIWIATGVFILINMIVPIFIFLLFVFGIVFEIVFDFVLFLSIASLVLSIALWKVVDVFVVFEV